MNGKRVLITGACGTVGSELIRQFVLDPQTAPDEIIGVDHNETELFFQDYKHLTHANVQFSTADIRDLDTLKHHSRGIDIIFHTAALKHVVLCERSPFEAVQTNILGIQNIIQAALENQVDKVIFTSSDKAVNPTNVMGTSKLMGERLMTAANSNFRSSKTCFASTRFGNVLGSSGSVIPIFHKQIAKGGPLTLTDKEMTRFVMTIQEAVRMIIDSSRLAIGGEVFVTKMHTIRIADLAEVMIEELAPQFGYDSDNIAIEVIGTKPGEKMYEELMNNEEMRRTMELSKFFAILPAFHGLYGNIDYNYGDNIVRTNLSRPYNSENETPLSKTELSSYLKENSLLPELNKVDNYLDSRYWPGDKESTNQ